MKNVIIAVGLVLVLILSAFISLTVYSHNSRQNEVEEALTVAVEQALENLMIDKQYTINNQEEFVADFTQRLILGIDSESTITVNILAVDIDKGLLDVEVVEEYTQLNGSVGTASYRKTVILETVVEDATAYHSVTFLVESGYGSGILEKYKEFTISHGSGVIFPGAKPTMEGHTFKGWSLTEPSADDGTTQELASDMNVEKDLVFYAVFE